MVKQFRVVGDRTKMGYYNPAQIMSYLPIKYTFSTVLNSGSSSRKILYMDNNNADEKTFWEKTKYV
jgi:hypothetical protein